MNDTTKKILDEAKVVIDKEIIEFTGDLRDLLTKVYIEGRIAGNREAKAILESSK